jgi:hypothetical protein
VVYVGGVITCVLGAPASGKSTVAPALAELLPGHAVLDWDALMLPAGALAGREIRRNPETWPAYRELIHAIVVAVAHLPVVLLGVCTPAELDGWPIETWVLLDCADDERRRRLARAAAPEQVEDAIRDGREYRLLGLPVIDTTGLEPQAVADDLAQFIQSLESTDGRAIWAPERAEQGYVATVYGPPLS